MSVQVNTLHSNYVLLEWGSHEHKTSAVKMAENRQVWTHVNIVEVTKRKPARSGRHVGGSSLLWKDYSSNICLSGSVFSSNFMGVQLLRKDEKYKHGKRKIHPREALKRLSFWQSALPFFLSLSLCLTHITYDNQRLAFITGCASRLVCFVDNGHVRNTRNMCVPYAANYITITTAAHSIASIW